MADSLFTKVISSVGKFLKADTSEVYDSSSKKKALAVDSSIFNPHYGGLGNVQTYGVRKPGKITFSQLR